MAIPNVIHFCFGLRRDFGGRPFSFVHYLAVKSAYMVHKPAAMHLYYAYEPAGKWWRAARPYLTLHKIEAPREAYGNALAHYAHRSDILRLDVLLRAGGIYLDMDCISLRSFQPLLGCECVLGWQGTRGLCNAVILAAQGAPFLARWRRQYAEFDAAYWDFHSVILPKILHGLSPDAVQTVGPQAFFYPLFWQPHFLWKKSARADFSGSFCVHLWETCWWQEYLKDLSPLSLSRAKNNFSLLAAPYLEGIK
jgi:hypothetical protein